LSYQRVDLQKDAKLYPSPLIEEVAGKGYEVEECPFEDETLTAEANEERSEDGGRWDARPAGDGAPMELSAADYAAMVRDPFMAVWTRRFKIAKAKYRGAVLDVASPLGASGKAGAALEAAAVCQKFDDAFVEEQTRAQVPEKFLGKFARKNLGIDQDWAVANVAIEDRNLLEDGGGTDGRVVICQHFFVGREDEPLITIPPACVIEPLYFALTRFAGANESSDFEYGIAVIDVEKQLIGKWVWLASHEEVCRHLDDIRKWYEKIPPSIGLGDTFTLGGYDSVREKLRTIDAVKTAQWDNWAKEMTDAAGGLVIDHVLDRWRRPPSGMELEEMFDQIFQLAMSGKCVALSGAEKESEGSHE
jgi:hypothetical protein